MNCSECGNKLLEDDGKIIPCETCIGEAYDKGFAASEAAIRNKGCSASDNPTEPSQNAFGGPWGS